MYNAGTDSTFPGQLCRDSRTVLSVHDELDRHASIAHIYLSYILHTHIMSALVSYGHGHASMIACVQHYDTYYIVVIYIYP
jgi:hypothetical protein